MTNHEIFLSDQFNKYLFSGNIDSAKKLLAEGVDINKKGARENFPIIAAINSGNPEVLSFIINNGGNVNLNIGDGWTPLHEAIDLAIDGMIQNNNNEPYREAMEMIKILLDNGAELNIASDDGKAPLDLINTYSGNIDNFNSLKNIFRIFIPDIDTRLQFDKNDS